VVKVLLFGKLRDIAGWRERVCDRPPATLSGLKALIGADDPLLAAALAAASAAAGVAVAVDRVLARGDISLPDGCEVAFMPAMSGG
jgi:molybdopterin synthase sulfur carrier subunit